MDDEQHITDVPFKKSRNRNRVKHVDPLFQFLQQKLDAVIGESISETFSAFFEYFRRVNDGTKLRPFKGRIPCLFLQGTCSDWNLLVDVCSAECKNVAFFSLASQVPTLDEVHDRIAQAQSTGKKLVMIVENVEALADEYFLDDLIDDVMDFLSPGRTKPLVLVLTSGTGVDMIYSKLSRHSLTRLEAECMTLPSPDRTLRTIMHDVCDFSFRLLDRPLPVFFDHRLLRYVWDRYTMQDQSLYALRATLLAAIAKYVKSEKVRQHFKFESLSPDSFFELEMECGPTLWYQQVFGLLVDFIFKEPYRRVDCAKRILKLHCDIQAGSQWFSKSLEDIMSLRSAAEIKKALIEASKLTSAKGFEMQEETANMQQVISDLEMSGTASKSTGVQLKKTRSLTDYIGQKDQVRSEMGNPARDRALKCLRRFFCDNLRPFSPNEILLVEFPSTPQLELFNMGATEVAKAGASLEADLEMLNREPHHFSMAYRTLLDASKEGIAAAKIPNWLYGYLGLSQAVLDDETQSEFYHDVAQFELIGAIRAVADDAVRPLFETTEAIEMKLPNVGEYSEHVSPEKQQSQAKGV